MGSYRSRLDIIADMLHVINRRAKKTQIMYQANLSYKLLDKYLMEIRDACLVRLEHHDRCYVLTSKGKRFLEEYREYSKRNRNVERQLDHMRVKKRALEELCSVE